MTAGSVLMGLGLIMWLIGGFWLDRKRRDEEVGGWSFFILGWFYGIYYGITRWPETKTPTIIGLGGIFLLIIGLIIP